MGTPADPMPAGAGARGTRPSRGVLVQYVALAVTWGASFLFVEIGLRGLSPAQIVLARLVIGAVTLAAVAASARQPLPRDRAVWAHLTVVAVLLCVAPFLLFAWAQQYLPSGLASIYNATTPLMAAAVAVLALPAERPTPARLAGLATGLLGVVVVLGPWRGAGVGSYVAQVTCLMATASYGAAFVYLRRFISPRGLPAIPVAAVQVGIGAGILVTLSPLIAAEPVTFTVPVVLSMLALGALGTGLAYVWNTNVVAGWGATGASTVTYLTPVVGVALGVLVLDEEISWNQPVGAVLVVVGIAVSQGLVVAAFPVLRSARRGGRGGRVRAADLAEHRERPCRPRSRPHGGVRPTLTSDEEE